MSIEGQVLSKGSGASDFLGTGRRKTAVARVRVRPGQGRVLINDRALETYFCNVQHRYAVLAPLNTVNKVQDFDIVIRVRGGGITGQADACKLGIARALKRCDSEFEEGLRNAGHLTRDSRMVERKKYGLRGARRGTQFSKR